MRFYGIKSKNRKDNFIYWYSRSMAKMKSLFPGKYHEYNKERYEFIFEQDDSFRHSDNGVPDNHWLKLNQIVTSDLIYREDIEKLQKGVRGLLRQHRAGDRFLALPIEGLDEICKRIDNMDSTLLSWYDCCKCGIFDFRGEQLESIIDYYSLQIKNINSSYLSLEFHVFLTEKKTDELQKLINMEYHDKRGYAYKTLLSKRNGGAYNSYTVMHYNDDFLKADKISDWISCIEWEFYNALRKYFPFVLHNHGIMPPRIEVLFTDIDYHDDHRFFWNSIGIEDYLGQFIDERQKVFFNHTKSREHNSNTPRIIYIVKDDGIEIGRLLSVKDKVNFHLEYYAKEYFIFFFLKIFSFEAGKKIVKCKHRLDKIKLKRNRLKNVLKQRYIFERDIDSYIRYSHDNIWDKSIEILRDEIYQDSDEIIKKIAKPFYTSYKSFCNGAISGSKKIDEMIDKQRNEFDNKSQILMHLSNYKNSSKNWHLNVIMLVFAALTLLFVIFPNRAVWAANMIKGAVAWILNLFK